MSHNLIAYAAYICPEMWLKNHLISMSVVQTVTLIPGSNQTAIANLCIHGVYTSHCHGIFCRDKLEEEAEFAVVGDLSELQAQAEPAEGASNGSADAQAAQGECR